METFNKKQVQQAKDLKARHQFICKYWGWEEKDDLWDKSEELFKVFQNFVYTVEKNMPAEEKKSSKSKGGATRNKVDVSQADLIKELQAKQAAAK